MQQEAPGLEMRDLVRRFGDVVALDGVSFAVQPGQLYGFVGANGAGKTTAMRIVMGIDEPDDGTVRWHGTPPSAEQRARFGYMPEERGLYPKMGAAAQLAYLARLHDLTGVHVLDDALEAGVRRTVLRVEHDGTARDAVLAAATDAGSVVAFEEVRPTLAELYREAVRQDDVDDVTAEQEQP